MLLIFFSGMSEDEKNHIRSKLLAVINEPNPQIAIQYVVAISKVIRFDYPSVWYVFAQCNI